MTECKCNFQMKTFQLIIHAENMLSSNRTTIKCQHKMKQSCKRNWTKKMTWNDLVVSRSLKQAKNETKKRQKNDNDKKWNETDKLGCKANQWKVVVILMRQYRKTKQKRTKDIFGSDENSPLN